MNIEAVWTKDIPHQFKEQKYSDLSEFMSLLDFMRDNSLAVFVDEDEIYTYEDFCDWIYSKSDPELSDIKRELMLKISRCVSSDESENEKMRLKIGRADQNKYFGLDFREDFAFYAASIKKMYQISRRFLSTEDRGTFKTDLSFCFPNIYFDESIGSSLNTLNRRFEEIREEIVEHLTAINNYRTRFCQMTGSGKGYREIALEFEKDNGIECSPQANRKNTKNLKRVLKNDQTGEMESVNCELHTKFKKYNIDRTKQDRIYFAPAREEICSGRSVVIHIGGHL